jgi:hypothetical protein
MEGIPHMPKFTSSVIETICTHPQESQTLLDPAFTAELNASLQAKFRRQDSAVQTSEEELTSFGGEGRVQAIVQALEEGATASASRRWSFPKPAAMIPSRIIEGSTLEPREAQVSATIGMVRPTQNRPRAFSIAVTWESDEKMSNAEDGNKLKLEDVPETVRTLLNGCTTEQNIDAWAKHCVAFCSFQSRAFGDPAEVGARFAKWWTIVKHVDLANDHPPNV